MIIPFKYLSLLLLTLCLNFGIITTSYSADPTANIWIDVRSEREFNASHLKNAVNIPHSQITDRIQSLALTKDTNIHLYCAVGGRAEIAKNKLVALGYSNVINEGGLKNLHKSGHPLNQ
ncbi:MAG: rhodanese-like domain-containing protein [Pseudomonadales bacterium]|nr:rhodanese-like domain-containing protein [Pseudomonadales bacterium]